MKLPFKKAYLRMGASFAALTVLLMSFQNCGKAGFDGELQESIPSEMSEAALFEKYGETNGRKVQAIPFAFEASFDTITYNSCAEAGLANAPGFFTLMAGSYTSGGFKIKNDFFSYADSNFKPIYPEVSLSENQYKEYLGDSPENFGLRPNMAIRVKNSLSDIFKVDNNVTLYKDVIPLVGRLTDSLIMDAMMTKGITANYFPFSQDERVVEGSWTYNPSEQSADEIRNIFMNSGILALTFGMDGKELNEVKSPSSSYPYRVAYGRGYSLTFGPPAPGAGQPAPATSNPNRVLAQVMESDLATPGTNARSWRCDRRYRVVSTYDQNKNPGLCPPHTFQELKNPAIRAELAIARRHLRADLWDVNVLQGCVIPKGGKSCYKETPVKANDVEYPVVEYNLSNECFRTNKADYLNGVPNSSCMHFVSICTRD